MFIAMNLFSVVPGKGDEFEAMWKSRETYLSEVAGFREFHLLKGENEKYISHSTWDTILHLTLTVIEATRATSPREYMHCAARDFS